MKRAFATLFSFRGTIDRLRFASFGVALIVAKVLFDRALARAYDQEWDWFSYWTFSPSSSADPIPPGFAFYATFALIALPFMAAGLSLTVRRLRDAALPIPFVLLFFVPAINLMFFVVLALVPPRSAIRGPRAEEPAPARIAAGLVPASRLGSAIAGAAVATIVGLLVVRFGTEVLETYALGLFVAAPFMVGLLASLIHGYREPRSMGEMIVVGQFAAASVGLGMLLLGWEGLLCLIMAAPLVLGVVLAGSCIAYVLQREMPPVATSIALVVVPFLVPMAIKAEASVERTPRLQHATTSIVIDAPPSVVWDRVVEFPKLGKPTSMWLRLGVAHPVGATIEGRGVGAVRKCMFTTGPFIEPITVWDEPKLLAFDVRNQPPTMRELSPRGSFDAPHLEGIFRSKRGEFRLKALPGGRTLLTGTTWYENAMWPQPYWKQWSSVLIHDIHSEVLRQVRDTAERDQRAAGDTDAGSR